MEPSLIPGTPISTTLPTASVAAGNTPPTSHINSVDSSPKSRNNSSSWDDNHQQQQPHAADAGKIRLMCSYGGHIIPRPHDKSLCYIGGDTRIFVTDRNTSLSDLSSRLSKTLLSNRPFWLKYQLPNEDLDSLISVTTDEDLENMIEEYDRVTKTSRIRVFLFTTEFDSVSSMGSLLQSSTKSEDWFVYALNNGGANSNSTTKVFSESSSVNCLLGLDDDVANCNIKSVDGQLDGSFGSKNVKVSAQDVQSVPDSPMVETLSSFGSTNSTPSLTNLPPIKVHVEENNQRVEIEEQFSQLGVGGSKVEQKQEEGGFMGMTSPPAPVTGTVFSGVPVVVGGEYVNRVYSDDERSDQSVGYRNPAQTQQQQPPQLQPKPIIVPSDLPSPNSVSSESSVTNPLSGQRHFFYQEQGGQIQSGNNRVSPNSVDMKHHSDPNNRAQVQQQQVQDAAGYSLPVQYDQQHQQMYQQPQQYVHASQYIHHTPSGPVPMTSYYPIYPSQQQQTHPHQHPALDQHQYPVYFVQSRPSQAYNLPVQQPNYSKSAPSNQPQTPPASSMARNPPASKPEMTAGAYRTAATGAPQLVQIPPGPHQHQQQYVGYSQIHHPSQPMAPTSAATGNYAYEQIYYSQAQAPQFPAQYQTMLSHNTSSLLPTEKNQPIS